MSKTKSKQRELPDNYEQRDSIGELTIVNDEQNIVITIHERDKITREMQNKYRWRVIGSKDQVGFYDGSFQSKSHAYEKAHELAQRH